MSNIEMMKKEIELYEAQGQQYFTPNNKVVIAGILEQEFEFENEVMGEKFYRSRVIVSRDSGALDYVPILVSDRSLDMAESYKNKMVEAVGQFRSYNVNNHVLLYVFTNRIEVYDAEESQDYEYKNIIYLDGFLCKTPIYRITPNGHEISDLLLAVNRYYGKSDYVPCIAWGRNAQFTGRKWISCELKVYGRIQSRIYQKKLESGEEIDKIAYEVSIMFIE